MTNDPVSSLVIISPEPDIVNDPVIFKLPVIVVDPENIAGPIFVKVEDPDINKDPVIV